MPPNCYSLHSYHHQYRFKYHQYQPRGDHDLQKPYKDHHNHKTNCSTIRKTNSINIITPSPLPQPPQKILPLLSPQTPQAPAANTIRDITLDIHTNIVIITRFTIDTTFACQRQLISCLSQSPLYGLKL
ncbi:hypothetical protein PoB_005935400 [Plakobranchus ocellatus]|uniref:Uncharacterized protein n=1 Tax=Plakobranchus ocellatus TaxID=259542 RepID=A0AAV4CN72_9GAST|nr:hypothetical protein PoB_005935400 [Plakobranchus ocellatus]